MGGTTEEAGRVPGAGDSPPEAEAAPAAGGDLPALRAAAARVGAVLSPAQVAALDRYRALTLAANERVNLTAVREPDAFERLGLVDAVGLLRVVGQAELAGARLVDVGSGAGLPGIPLAIMAPGLRLTLIEATGKKAAYLAEAVTALGLPEVAVHHGRAEELAHRRELRERFDLVTARAVAALPTLLELCLPFLHRGGRLLAPKKLGIEAELEAAGPALRRLGGRLEAAVPLDLPDLPDHQVIVVRKVGPTPPAYPRRPGLPAHQPLL